MRRPALAALTLTLALLARPARATCIERCGLKPAEATCAPDRLAFRYSCEACCWAGPREGHCTETSATLPPGYCPVVQGIRQGGGPDSLAIHLESRSCPAGPAWASAEALPAGVWQVAGGPNAAIGVPRQSPTPVALPGELPMAFALASGPAGLALATVSRPDRRLRVFALDDDLRVAAQVDLGPSDESYANQPWLAPSGEGWAVAFGRHVTLLDAHLGRLASAALPNEVFGLLPRPGAGPLALVREALVMPLGRDGAQGQLLDLLVPGLKPAGLPLGAATPTGALVALPLRDVGSLVVSLDASGRVLGRRLLPGQAQLLVPSGAGALLAMEDHLFRLGADGVPEGPPTPMPASGPYLGATAAGAGLAVLGAGPRLGQGEQLLRYHDGQGHTWMAQASLSKQPYVRPALVEKAGGALIAAWLEAGGLRLARLERPSGAPVERPAPRACQAPGPDAPCSQAPLATPTPAAPDCPYGAVRACVRIAALAQSAQALAVAARGDVLGAAWVTAPGSSGSAGVQLALGEAASAAPSCLGWPDARAVSLASTRAGWLLAVETWSGIEVAALAPEGGEPRPALRLPGGTGARLLAGPHGALLLWSDAQNALQAQPLDEAGQRVGPAVHVLAGLAPSETLTAAMGPASTWVAASSEGGASALALDARGRVTGRAKLGPGRVRALWTEGEGAVALLEEPDGRHFQLQRLGRGATLRGKPVPLAATWAAGSETLLNYWPTFPAQAEGSGALLVVPWGVLRVGADGTLTPVASFAIPPLGAELARTGLGLVLAGRGARAELFAARLGEPEGVGRACWVEQACPSGLSCRAQARTACTTNADCGPGRRCAQLDEGRACVYVPCAADGGCPGSGLACVGGVCAPRPCRASPECGADAHCVDGPGGPSCQAAPGQCAR